MEIDELPDIWEMMKASIERQPSKGSAIVKVIRDWKPQPRFADDEPDAKGSGVNAPAVNPGRLM